MKIPKPKTAKYLIAEVLFRNGKMTIDAIFALTGKYSRQRIRSALDTMLNDDLSICLKSGNYSNTKELLAHFSDRDRIKSDEPPPAVATPRTVRPFVPLSKKYCPSVFGTRQGSNDLRAMPSRFAMPTTKTGV